MDAFRPPAAHQRPKLLAISYGFPPVGGTGARRIAKMVKYLDREGWDAVVLTPRRVLRNQQDPDAAADLPSACTVIRTPTWEPVSSKSPHSRTLLRLRRVANIPLLPSVAGLWVLPSFPYFIRAVEAHRPRVVFSTGPDFTSHVIASWLATRFHLPLVLDYRDEWTTHPLREQFVQTNVRKRDLAKRLKYRVDHQLEKQVLGRADRIVTTTSGIGTHMSNVFQIPIERFEVLTNGFDPDEIPTGDFREVQPGEMHQKPSRTIAHLGSFFRESQKVDSFFQALRDLAEQKKEPVVYRQIGFVDGAFRRWMESFRSEYFKFEFITHLPAREAIARAASSDLLVAFCRGRGEERYINLKIFEYFRCDAPILSICRRESESAKLIEVCGGGTALDVDAGDSARAWLEKWWDGEGVSPRNTSEIEKLAWPQLGKQLAQILAELTPTTERGATT